MQVFKRTVLWLGIRDDLLWNIDSHFIVSLRLGLLNDNQCQLFGNRSITFRCGCADWRELPLIVSGLQHWHTYEPALAKSHSWLCRAYSTRHSRSGELIVYWLIFCYSKSVSNLTPGWPQTRHGGEGVGVERGFTVRGVRGQCLVHGFFWTNQRPTATEVSKHFIICLGFCF